LYLLIFIEFSLPPAKLSYNFSVLAGDRE